MTILRIARIFCFAVATAPVALAQATAAASRAIGITTFATAGFTDTAYRQTNPSVTFGQDIRLNLLPSWAALELRTSFTGGNAVREQTMLVGFQAERRGGGLYPYLNVLAGIGKIQFPLNATYKEDRSSIYQVGGGLDAPLRGPFYLRLDAQLQSWRLGADNPRIYPAAVTVGIAFRSDSPRRRSAR